MHFQNMKSPHLVKFSPNHGIIRLNECRSLLYRFFCSNLQVTRFFSVTKYVGLQQA